MKIRYMSDLHLDINKKFIMNSIYISLEEYYEHCFSNEQADVLILAGDLAELCRKHTISTFLKAASCFHNKIIWVFGNHEYYSQDCMPGIEEYSYVDLYERKFPKLTILLDDCVDIGDIRIYGSTLWSLIFDKPHIVSKRLNDFNYIKGMTIDKYNQLHKEALNKIREADIVVTHHAPCINSVNAKYVGDMLNQCYYSNTLDYMLEHNIKLPQYWIHGHIHDPVNYLYKDTRVLSNPYGYGMENPQFSYDKFIEIF